MILHQINKTKKMRSYKILFIVFLSITQAILIEDSKSQGAENKIQKSINIDKVDSTTPISASSIKDALDDIFTTSKIKSLMYDEEQFNNIEKAIEAMRNNQSFTPEGAEAKKQSAEDAKKQAEEIKTLEESEDNVKSYVFLSSIMYFGEKQWSLWINDKKFIANSNSNENELFFKVVSQDKATIVWRLSISKWKILSGKKSEEYAPKINENNQVEVEFTLKPNQTFILSSNKVVDGRAVDSINRRK
jgi:hypothetical protein